MITAPTALVPACAALARHAIRRIAPCIAPRDPELADRCARAEEDDVLPLAALRRPRDPADAMWSCRLFILQQICTGEAMIVDHARHGYARDLARAALAQPAQPTLQSTLAARIPLAIHLVRALSSRLRRDGHAGLARRASDVTEETILSLADDATQAVGRVWLDVLLRGEDGPELSAIESLAVIGGSLRGDDLVALACIDDRVAWERATIAAWILAAAALDLAGGSE